MRVIDIFCSHCRTQLYRYLKENPKGQLVKCYLDRIKKDFTGGKPNCPNCGIQFARPLAIHGKRANKIIQGKVFHR